MSRDLARQPKTDSAARTIDWGSVGAGFLTFSLIGVGWVIFHALQSARSRSLLAFIFLVFLQIALVLFIKRGIQPLGMGSLWEQRVGFFAAVLLGIGYLTLGALSGTSFDFIGLFIWILGVMVGSFSGALISTVLQEGWAENNSPPSRTIQQLVYHLHQQRIGQGDPVDAWKRVLDIMIALAGIIISSPVWLMSILLIWIENPGPILFVKNSVTQGGRNFRQYKFRTMVRSAEAGTGPVLAKEHDERVLHFGGVLRKTALDELPQLLNILRGEMSFVGPRPQRTVLVADYLQSIPEYAERHRVLPGLAGLAQVAGDYYLTPRQKLRFDRLYIQHSSLGFDLKLLGLAFLITFWYRWQPGWNGRLPRRYLHSPRKRS